MAADADEGRGRSIALRQTPLSTFQILSLRSRVTPNAQVVRPSSEMEEAMERSWEGEEAEAEEE